MPTKGRGTTPAAATATSMVQGEDLGEIGGLSLDSSPVKPSSSAQTRSSSSEPSSGSGQGNGLPMFIQQEDMEDLDDDDDEEGGKKGKKGGIPNPGRRKIEIEYIEDKASAKDAAAQRKYTNTTSQSKRHITFSKRKAGIMKKVWPPPRCLSIDVVDLGDTLHRRTSSQRSLEPKYYCWSSQRPGSSTPTPQTSFSRSSPQRKARLSSR